MGECIMGGCVSLSQLCFFQLQKREIDDKGGNLCLAWRHVRGGGSCDNLWRSVMAGGGLVKKG